MAINVSNFTKICIFGTCTSHLVPGHHIVSADIQLKMLVVLAKHLSILKMSKNRFVTFHHKVQFIWPWAISPGRAVGTYVMAR